MKLRTLHQQIESDQALIHSLSERERNLLRHEVQVSSKRDSGYRFENRDRSGDRR
jgi:hypothetical protein